MPRLSFFILLFVARIACAELCNPDEQFCAGDHHHSSSSQAYPSSNSKLNFNPSTVPTSRGIGLEFIYFKSIDFAIVTGTGRAGAAISPSNSEETFFGAPGFETFESLYDRHVDKTKFPTQKYTLATAFNLYNNGGEGLDHVTFNIGVMAKYNTVSGSIVPGVGASSLVGPFSFSYAFFLDETNIDQAPYFPGVNDKIKYNIQTYSVGLTLGILSLDYSVLNLKIQDQDAAFTAYVDAFPATVSVATASLFYKRGIYTLAARQENSERPAFDYPTQNLISQNIKNEIFGSFQFITTKYLFLGVFYNYYLMREAAGAVTIFF